MVWSKATLAGLGRWDIGRLGRECKFSAHMTPTHIKTLFAKLPLSGSKSCSVMPCLMPAVVNNVVLRHSKVQTTLESEQSQRVVGRIS